MKALLIALNSQYMHTNLAIRQLYAAARGKTDVQLEILEEHINLPYHRVLEDIARRKADVMAFSCYIWNIGYVLRLCRALRLAMPGAVIALGGPEVSYDAEDCLSREHSVDCVLTGEGEAAIAPFLEACAGRADFAEVPGLCWRAPEGIRQNASAPCVPPALWPDVYADGCAEGLRNRIVYIETSRGCPFGCRYCLSSRDPVRALPADESIRRLTALAEAGVKLIKLVDRTFNFDRARAAEIWRGLTAHALRTGVKCTYHFEIAANLMDEAGYQALEAAPPGLFQLEVGIQSSSDEVLRAVGRTVMFEPVRDAVQRLTRLHGVHLHVDLIAGLPHEDLERFGRSFDDAFALGAEQLQLGFLKLLKGSGLRRDAEKYGIVYDPEAPYEVISTADISFEELCFLKDVETVLEWYRNSGRYPTAVRLLTTGRRPFEAFSALAKAFRAEGVLDVEQGEQGRAEALLRCGAALCDGQLLGEAICHDLLSASRRRDLPSSLAFEESAEQRAVLRERFRPVRGQSLKVYPHDVLHYQQTGEWIARETPLIYDRLEVIRL